MVPLPYIHKNVWNFQSIKLIFFYCFENYIEWTKKFRNVTKLTSFIELYESMHSLRDLVTCPAEWLPIHGVCQICVYILGCFVMCSTRNQSKSGIKKTVVLKYSYNVFPDSEPMHHVTRAQTSRPNGTFSAVFISWAIELCDVSRAVLY